MMVAAVTCCMRNKKYIGWMAVAAFLPVPVRAHCPLCTTAVGGAVVGAAALGLPVGIVALLGGALLASSGLWLASALRKRSKARWVHHRATPHIIVWATLASLIIPLMLTPSVRAASTSMELLIIGANEWAVTIDWLLVGGIIGTLTMYAGFWISDAIKRQKGRVLIPFQGIAITFALLVVESGLLWVMR